VKTLKPMSSPETKETTTLSVALNYLDVATGQVQEVMVDFQLFGDEVDHDPQFQKSESIEQSTSGAKKEES